MISINHAKASEIKSELLYHAEIDDATLVGQGVLKVYWANVYTLSYYIKDDNKDGIPELIALGYNYLREVPKQATIKASLDEFKRYPEITDEKLVSWLNYLDRALTDMKMGEQAIITRTYDGVISFYVKDLPTVIIKDTEFSQVFVDIWLGTETSYPKLRKQLLNLN